ncbi:putative xyloglucan 6-xylosyltransferase 1 [Bienertia sinuspersici]
MERAFNFGDNQVLKLYGFAHTSLTSRRVKRIRNEVKDEKGIEIASLLPIELVDLIKLSDQT